MFALTALVAPIATILMQIAALAPPAAAADDKPRQICKRIVPTGSIMAKRFCLTKREWQELDDTTGDKAGNFLGRKNTGTCRPTCE